MLKHVLQVIFRNFMKEYSKYSLIKKGKCIIAHLTRKLCVCLLGRIPGQDQLVIVGGWKEQYSVVSTKLETVQAG